MSEVTSVPRAAAAAAELWTREHAREARGVPLDVLERALAEVDDVLDADTVQIVCRRAVRAWAACGLQQERQ